MLVVLKHLHALATHHTHTAHSTQQLTSVAGGSRQVAGDGCDLAITARPPPPGRAPS